MAVIAASLEPYRAIDSRSLWQARGQQPNIARIWRVHPPSRPARAGGKLRLLDNNERSQSSFSWLDDRGRRAARGAGAALHQGRICSAARGLERERNV